MTRQRFVLFEKGDALLLAEQTGALLSVVKRGGK